VQHSYLNNDRDILDKMSGNIILHSMKKKETIALSKILEAMKLLGKADPNSKKILEEAEKDLGIGNKKKRETGEIKFTVPPHDLRTWLDTVRKQGVKPKSGIHYREINVKTEVNIEKASYTVLESDWGYKEMNEKQMYNPKLTEEEKTNAYYEGRGKARKHNETAKNTSPTWILVEKDDECNTRDEDTMLRYLDQKKEVIDWYASVRNLSSYGARTGYTMK
jgi:hypothetical protein